MNKIVSKLLLSSLVTLSAQVFAESGANQTKPCGAFVGQNGIQLTEHTGSLAGSGTCYVGIKDDIFDKINQDTNINSNAISDLNNHLSDTDKNVINNSNAISDMNGHLSNTDKNVTNNSNAINDLNNHLNNTDKNVTNNSNAISDINSHLNESDKTLADHSNAINDLHNGAVLYDGSDKDQVTFNPGGDNVTLTNVANGQVISNSKDAINGGQLWQTNQHVNANSNAISDLNNHMSDTDKNVAGNSNAINHLDNRVTHNENTINNIVNGKVGLVQTDGKTTTIDKDGTSDTVSIAGTGGNRVITGVAPGAVTADSNEAINGSQLFNMYQQIKFSNNQRYNALSNRVEHNRKIAAKGIASAMAMQIDMPDEVGSFAGGVGLGTYDGETAMALGTHYLSTDGKYKYSAAVSSNLSGQAKIGGKLSFGFRF
ncbi:YadA-like family protein [Neisseriaceae bacterium ESL0693]|nr:YadA-like family protein [Neisseriaceae bacterium ESL0693]